MGETELVIPGLMATSDHVCGLQTWRTSLGHVMCLGIRDVRFGSKVAQIGPKWEKSGAFSDQIQYILARRAKMY